MSESKIHYVDRIVVEGVRPKSLRLENHQLRFFKMPSCLSFNGAMVVLVAGVLVLVKMVRMVKHGGWVGLLMGA